MLKKRIFSWLLIAALMVQMFIVMPAVTVYADTVNTLGSGFNYPAGIAVDSSGNIYVADTGNNAIKRMDANGDNITILGSGFSYPEGVAVDGSGNIYVADSGNDEIKRMDANGDNITPLGTGFYNPTDVAVDSSGNIYIADNGNDAIKRMDASGNNITTLGSGFSEPSGVAVDSSGNIYVADSDNNAIKRMDASGNNITALGSGFGDPRGVTVDGSGNIYVADSNNNAVKRMDASGNNIAVLGSGFDFPMDVAVDGSGNVYVADNGNDEVKKISETALEFAGGDGTIGTPYQITNWEQLNNVRNYLGPGNEEKHFVLMNDLNSNTDGYAEYAGPAANGGKGWLPIGTGGSGAAATHFAGTFDGNVKVIEDLLINDSSMNFAGLFGTVNWNAEIKDVRLQDVDITGNGNVGGLAGYNFGSITGSSVAGTVSGAWRAGGLVGHCEFGSIVKSYAICTVTGSGEYGWAVGGLVGYLDANNGVIEDSFALGSVSGPEITGGLAGYSGGVITNSYAACSVTCDDDGTAGGLVGEYSDAFGSISSSYYDSQISGQTDAGKGTPKTTEEMKTGNTFDGDWNFTDTWTIIEEDDKVSYPYLQWMEELEGWNETMAPGYTLPPPAVPPVAPQGEGTSSSPYLIAEPGNLIWMSAQSSGASGFHSLYFEQTADIDMSTASDFTPIGNGGTPFKGNYDGSDFNISNLTINSDLQYVGLFASIASAATIKDLELRNASVTSSYAATSDYAMVGGFAGQNLGTIQDCHITESAEGLSTISSVNGRHVFIGGIVGDNDNYSGTITMCSNTGDVIVGGGASGGIYAAGGLAGYNLGIIDNCMNRGSVSTTDSNAALIYVGGVAGNHAGGAVEYCINLGAVILSGGSESKGGIVGYTTAAFSAVTVINNFYIEGLAQNGIAMIGFDPGTSEGAASKTEAQMKDPSTFAGWDTEKWTINAGSYPALKGLRVDSGDPPYIPGSPGKPSRPINNVTITINGQTQQQAATVNTVIQNGRTNTVVTLDAQKTSSLINSSQPGSRITVPVDSTASDMVTGVLNGELIKAMENKQTTLEIRTSTASYILPAQQIDISSISQSLGQDVRLSDIKVQIEIAKASDETGRVVENSAKDGSFSIVVPPVEFNITCTYGENTVNVSRFNAYVERAVAIPEGIDPQKITTGIVVEPDGTYRHVPTQIIMIDGKYYAKINSLTNSTYSVIWNPVEFADAAKHWAEAAINDMGSRMIVSGDENGNFAPNRDITRAEFAAVVVRALGLTSTGGGENQFADVKDTTWYSGSVTAAYEYGIINGYESDLFKPQNKITREQAMAMIGRAMCITGLKTMEELSSADSEKQLADYSDAGGVSKYAKSGIAACIEFKVVNGKSAGRIAPKENITRAEVAVIIKRLLEESDLI